MLLIVMAIIIAAPAVSLAQAQAGYGIGVLGLVAGQDYVAGQVIVGLKRWGKEGETPALADEGFGPLSGTSMASPIVAGAAALVWGQFPALTRAQLIARLVNNGKVISCGFAAATRRVDVRRAIFQNAETVVIGRVLEGVTGKPQTPTTVPGTIRVRSGVNGLGSDLTNRGGSYEVFGPAIAGLNRNLLGEKAGYITDILRSPLTVLNGVSTGPFTDALSKTRPAGYCHGTLDWKTTQPVSAAAGAATTGWELDLGLRLPSGTVFPFGPIGDLTAAPFVLLPRDSFEDLEPVEAFVIGPPAANGVYRVVVGRFLGPALNLNASLAQVRIFSAANPVLFLNAPACTPVQFWHVANLTKNGLNCAVAAVNACVANFP
ncbi:MAG TPA: S8 family serine peptidase [Candidatus Tectomicrobia bacterium]